MHEDQAPDDRVELPRELHFRGVAHREGHVGVTCRARAFRSVLHRGRGLIHAEYRARRTHQRGA